GSLAPFYHARRRFTRTDLGLNSHTKVLPAAARGSRVFRIAVQQLDRDALRPAQKANLDAWPWRMRLLGELDALLLEIGGDGVDACHRQAEMVEPLIGRGGRCVDAVTGQYLGGEDIGAAELDVDARFAGLR